MTLASWYAARAAHRMDALNFTRLSYFGAVAQAGSITRAAQALNVAQPALSRQMRLLEDEIGARLLDRRPSGVVPTEAGKLLLDRAASILSQLAAVRTEVREVASPSQVAFRVAAPPMLARYLESEFLDRFSRALPCVTMQVTEAWTGTVAKLLKSDLVDFGVLCGRQLGEFDSSALLASERLYVVQASALQSGGRASIPAAALADMDLVLPVKENGTRLLLDRFFEEAGCCPRIKFEAASWGAIKSLVEDGRAAAILPMREVREIMDRRKVVTREIEGELRHELHLASYRRRPSDIEVSAIELLIRAFRAKLEQKPAWRGVSWRMRVGTSEHAELKPGGRSRAVTGPRSRASSDGGRR